MSPGWFLHQGSLKFKQLWKVAALCVLITFSASNLALTAPSLESIPTAFGVLPLAQELREILIPENLGRTSEVFFPENASPDSPLIVYFEDAHSNLGAQRNIGALTRELAAKLNIQAILVEGGSGEANLSKLREFQDKKAKEEATEFWMKHAVLSGVEREAITSPRNFRFFGVEDKTLYEKSGALFLKTSSHSAQFLFSLAPLIRENAAKKKQIYNSELIRFEKSTLEFEGKEKLAQLVRFLAGEARNRHVNRWKYLEIEKFINLFLLENDDRSNQVNNSLSLAKQRERVGVRVDDRVSQFPPHPSPLPLRQRRIRPLAERGRGEKNMPSLTLNTFDIRKLLKEIKFLETEIKETLFQSNQERVLDSESHILTTFQNMASLKATPDDIRYFLNNQDRIFRYVQKSNVILSPSRVILNGVKDLALRVNSVKDLSSLDSSAKLLADKSATLGMSPRNDEFPEALKIAFAFYKFAKMRDQVMFENLKRILKTEKIKRAILVTGGFHAPGITARLRENKIPYVLVTPKISEEENGKNYFARISGKRADLEAFKFAHPSLATTSTYAAQSALLNQNELGIIRSSIEWLGQSKTEKISRSELRIENFDSVIKNFQNSFFGTFGRFKKFLLAADVLAMFFFVWNKDPFDSLYYMVIVRGAQISVLNAAFLAILRIAFLVVPQLTHNNKSGKQVGQKKKRKHRSELREENQPVDFNQLTREQLSQLFLWVQPQPKTREKLVQRVVDGGPYSSWDDLVGKVKGIGYGTVSILKSQLPQAISFGGTFAKTLTRKENILKAIHSLDPSALKKLLADLVNQSTLNFLLFIGDFTQTIADQPHSLEPLRNKISAVASEKHPGAHASLSEKILFEFRKKIFTQSNQDIQSALNYSDNKDIFFVNLGHLFQYEFETAESSDDFNETEVIQLVQEMFLSHNRESLVQSVQRSLKDETVTSEDILTPLQVIEFQSGRYQRVLLVLTKLKDDREALFVLSLARSPGASSRVQSEFHNLKRYFGDPHVVQVFDLFSVKRNGQNVHGYSSEFVNDSGELQFVTPYVADQTAEQLGRFRVMSPHPAKIIEIVDLFTSQVVSTAVGTLTYFYDWQNQTAIGEFDISSGDINLNLPKDLTDRITKLTRIKKLPASANPLEFLKSIFPLRFDQKGGRLVAWRSTQNGVDIPHFLDQVFSLKYLDDSSSSTSITQIVLASNAQDKIRDGVLNGVLNGLIEKYGSDRGHEMTINWMEQYLSALLSAQTNLLEQPFFSRRSIEKFVRELKTSRTELRNVDETEEAARHFLEEHAGVNFDPRFFHQIARLREKGIKHWDREDWVVVHEAEQAYDWMMGWIKNSPYYENLKNHPPVLLSPEGIVSAVQEGQGPRLASFDGGLGVLFGEWIRALAYLGGVTTLKAFSDAPEFLVFIPNYLMGAKKSQIDAFGYPAIGARQSGRPQDFEIDYVKDPSNPDNPLEVEIPLDDQNAASVRFRAVPVGSMRIIMAETDQNEGGKKYLLNNLYQGFMGSKERFLNEWTAGLAAYGFQKKMGYQNGPIHLNETATFPYLFGAIRNHLEELSKEYVKHLVPQYVNRGMTQAEAQNLAFEQAFEDALELTGSRIVFFTHTLVSAGIDRFHEDKVQLGSYINHYFQESNDSLVRDHSGEISEWFIHGKASIAHQSSLPGFLHHGEYLPLSFIAKLANRFGGSIVAVSQRNALEANKFLRDQGILSEDELQARPVTAVTNGVDHLFWGTPELLKLMNAHQSDPSERTPENILNPKDSLAAEIFNFVNAPNNPRGKALPEFLKNSESKPLISDEELTTLAKQYRIKLVQMIRRVVQKQYERNIRFIQKRRLKNEVGFDEIARMGALQKRLDDWSGTNDGRENELVHLLNPDQMIVVWSRRVVTYKRMLFLLFGKNLPLVEAKLRSDRALDPDEINQLITQAARDGWFREFIDLVTVRKMQFVFAGKTSAREGDSMQAIFEHTIEYLGQEYPEIGNKVVLLEGYDETLSQLMVRGASIWLNTPEAFMEASGTSGMKISFGVNFFPVLDGWGSGGIDRGLNGLSGKRPPEVNAAHPKYWNGNSGDARPLAERLKESPEAYSLRLEAENLYTGLQDAAQMFYENPTEWLSLVRRSIYDLATVYDVRGEFTGRYVPSFSPNVPGGYEPGILYLYDQAIRRFEMVKQFQGLKYLILFQSEPPKVFFDELVRVRFNAADSDALNKADFYVHTGELGSGGWRSIKVSDDSIHHLGGNTYEIKVRVPFSLPQNEYGSERRLGVTFFAVPKGVNPDEQGFSDFRLWQGEFRNDVFVSGALADWSWEQKLIAYSLFYDQLALTEEAKAAILSLIPTELLSKLEAGGYDTHSMQWAIHGLEQEPAEELSSKSKRLLLYVNRGKGRIRIRLMSTEHPKQTFIEIPLEVKDRTIVIYGLGFMQEFDEAKEKYPTSSHPAFSFWLEENLIKQFMRELGFGGAEGVAIAQVSLSEFTLRYVHEFKPQLRDGLNIWTKSVPISNAVHIKLRTELRATEKLTPANEFPEVWSGKDYVALAFIGMLAGFLAANLGIGGGVVMVSLLHFFYGDKLDFKKIIHIAVATMVVNASFSVFAHSIVNPQNFEFLSSNHFLVLRIMILPALLGSWAGDLAFRKLHSTALKKLFSVALLLIALTKYLIPSLLDVLGVWHTAPALTVEMGNHFNWDTGSALKLSALGFLAGFFGPLIGLGGGIFMVPALHSYFGFTFTNAIVTSLSMMIPIALHASILRGRQHLNISAMLALASVPTLFFGAFTANYVFSPHTLETALGVVMAVVSLKLFFNQSQDATSNPNRQRPELRMVKENNLEQPLSLEQIKSQTFEYAIFVDLGSESIPALTFDPIVVVVEDAREHLERNLNLLLQAVNKFKVKHQILFAEYASDYRKGLSRIRERNLFRFKLLVTDIRFPDSRESSNSETPYGGFFVSAIHELNERKEADVKMMVVSGQMSGWLRAPEEAFVFIQKPFGSQQPQLREFTERFKFFAELYLNPATSKDVSRVIFRLRNAKSLEKLAHAIWLARDTNALVAMQHGFNWVPTFMRNDPSNSEQLGYDLAVKNLGEDQDLKLLTGGFGLSELGQLLFFVTDRKVEWAIRKRLAELKGRVKPESLLHDIDRGTWWERGPWMRFAKKNEAWQFNVAFQQELNRLIPVTASNRAAALRDQIDLVRAITDPIQTYPFQIHAESPNRVRSYILNVLTEIQTKEEALEKIKNWVKRLELRRVEPAAKDFLEEAAKPAPRNELRTNHRAAERPFTIQLDVGSNPRAKSPLKFLRSLCSAGENVTYDIAQRSLLQREQVSFPISKDRLLYLSAPQFDLTDKPIESPLNFDLRIVQKITEAQFHSEEVVFHLWQKRTQRGGRTFFNPSGFSGAGGNRIDADAMPSVHHMRLEKKGERFIIYVYTTPKGIRQIASKFGEPGTEYQFGNLEIHFEELPLEAVNHQIYERILSGKVSVFFLKHFGLGAGKLRLILRSLHDQGFEDIRLGEKVTLSKSVRKEFYGKFVPEHEQFFVVPEKRFVHTPEPEQYQKPGEYEKNSEPTEVIIPERKVPYSGLNQALIPIYFSGKIIDWERSMKQAFKTGAGSQYAFFPKSSGEAAHLLELLLDPENRHVPIHESLLSKEFIPQERLPHFLEDRRVALSSSPFDEFEAFITHGIPGDAQLQFGSNEKLYRPADVQSTLKQMKALKWSNMRMKAVLPALVLKPGSIVQLTAQNDQAERFFKEIHLDYRETPLPAPLINEVGNASNLTLNRKNLRNKAELIAALSRGIPADAVIQIETDKAVIEISGWRDRHVLFDAINHPTVPNKFGWASVVEVSPLPGDSNSAYLLALHDKKAHRALGDLLSSKDIYRTELRKSSEGELPSSILISFSALAGSAALREEFKQALEKGTVPKKGDSPFFQFVILAPEFQSDLLAEREVTQIFGENIFAKYANVELYNDTRAQHAVSVLNRAVNKFRSQLGLKPSEFSTRVVVVGEEKVLRKLSRRDTPKILAHEGAIPAALLLMRLEGSIDWMTFAQDGLIHPSIAFTQTLYDKISADLLREMAA